MRIEALNFPLDVTPSRELIGATPEGKKELLGFTDGARESAQDWRELLLDLKARGLTVVPKLAVADCALGFWTAVGEVWPTTREQRCWVPKTANGLGKLPKSQQPKAKRSLQEICMAATRVEAMAAFDACIAADALKYEKATDGLEKDREALLAFYEVPAEPWKHLPRSCWPHACLTTPLASTLCRLTMRETVDWLTSNSRAISAPLLHSDSTASATSLR
jgi:transposase-like protein